MLQRLSSLGQENEKLQDDGQQTSTAGSQPEIAIQKEELDDTRMREISSQPRNDTTEFSKEEEGQEEEEEEGEGKEHGTQSRKCFFF